MSEHTCVPMNDCEACFEDSQAEAARISEVEAERDRAQSAACSICGSAQSHCAAVAHEQAETINRLGGAVEVLRKLMQWVDTHPRKATIVESLKSEARALLAAASVLALSSPSEQEEVR
jgi:hypothetical protein